MFNGCWHVQGSKNGDDVAENNLLSMRSAVKFHAGVFSEETVSQDMYTTSATKQEVITKLNATRLEQVIAKLNEDPFQQWRYKSTWPQLSDLKLNSELMSSAIQPGDPTRLKNVLLKALRGHDVNLVVIGGSNSAGGKLGVDEGSLDGLFFKVFTDWWNDTFGKAMKTFVKEYKVTIGGTGSYVFAYCYRTFLPKEKGFDVVLIEGSVNGDNAESKAESLEQLTRQVLAEPSMPAVLYINLVSGLGLDPETKKVVNPSCINMENFGQTDLARHYGITSFSLKEVLCRKERDRWKAVITDFVGSDGRHIGIKAHAQVAMMMIEYVRGVFEDVLNDVSSGVYAKEITLLALPGLFFLKRETEVLKEPSCWTGITPNISQCFYPTLSVEVVESKGFSPKGSLCDGQNLDEGVISDLRTDDHGGWIAWGSYSILKLRIYVPPSQSQSPNSRSVTIMTHASFRGSKAMVWLDDDVEKTISIDVKSIWGGNHLNTVATRVEPGHHVITVKTVRWGIFLVTGIVVGPPDFERQGAV